MCCSRGRHELGPLIAGSAGYSVGALVLLLVCKGLAYGVSLGSFRGGPVFPAMFLGAAGGIALSHFGGLPLVAGAAMGIGAMCVGDAPAARLPRCCWRRCCCAPTGWPVMPLVIVAVTVAHVAAARLQARFATAGSAAVPPPARSTDDTAAAPASRSAPPAG